MADLKPMFSKLKDLDGYVGACVVDSTSGMMLGADGGNGFNLEIAAAGNTEVVRSKRQTMRSLGLKDSIEDILITLQGQYHLIRPLAANDAIFIYLVLDRGRGNLALSRLTLSQAEKAFSLN